MTKVRVHWRPLIAAHFTYQKNGELYYKRGPRNGLTAEMLINMANKAYGLDYVYDPTTAEGSKLINSVQSSISTFFKEYGIRDFEGAGGTFHPRLYFIPENKSQSRAILGSRIPGAQGRIEAVQGLSRKYNLIEEKKQKTFRSMNKLLESLKKDDE